MGLKLLAAAIVGTVMRALALSIAVVFLQACMSQTQESIVPLPSTKPPTVSVSKLVEVGPLRRLREREDPPSAFERFEALDMSSSTYSLVRELITQGGLTLGPGGRRLIVTIESIVPAHGPLDDAGCRGRYWITTGGDPSIARAFSSKFPRFSSEAEAERQCVLSILFDIITALGGKANFE